jgi:hypothetical protein
MQEQPGWELGLERYALMASSCRAENQSLGQMLARLSVLGAPSIRTMLGGKLYFRTRTAWLTFCLSLAVWPVYSVAEGFYKNGWLKSRWAIDHSMPFAASLGFLGCVLAPFLCDQPLKRKTLFAFLAVVAFILDFFASALAFLTIIGFPKD